MNSARSEVLQNLARQISEIEANCLARPHQSISFGIPALDALLPQKSLPAGALVELISATLGAGAWTLALLMAKHACGDWKALIVIDDQRWFYPPAAAKLGIDLTRLIVVRPCMKKDVFLATNQSLRCAAVGAVLAGYDQLRTVDARRLQMAAERGGGVGFLLRPPDALKAPSFANLRLRIAPVASSERGRRLRIEVVRCRGGKAGRVEILEIDDETGHVRVPPELASAKTLSRPARASG